MKLSFVVIALALLLSSPAKAEDSTQELLSACRPIAEADVTGDYVRFPQTYNTGYCWGVFTGIQKIIVHVDKRKEKIYGVCAPPESTLSQLIAVFTAYAKKNPQRLHEDYFKVALDSLRDAFPCH